ncbi:hypothetical protein ACQ4PT_052073 [Festuca glaucescens]
MVARFLPRVKPLRAGPVRRGAVPRRGLRRRAPRRPCRGGGLRRRDGALLRGTSPPLAAADPFAISLAFKACAAAAADATSLHAFAVRSSAVTSVYVATALADPYAKAGRLAFALRVFDEMPRKYVVSWTAFVGALTRAGRRHDALRRFAEMRASGVPCDAHVCAAALTACAEDATGLLSRHRPRGARALRQARRRRHALRRQHALHALRAPRRR